jgi:prevent-host-death family protein
MNVGVRELKSHLSGYLARVRAGETIVVTDRGKPIARLDSVSADPPDAYRDLVSSGQVIDKGPPHYIPHAIKLLPGDKDSTDFVREQRR